MDDVAYRSPAPREETSPSGAVERAVDAAQHIALIGWCALMGGGVVLLRERVSLPAGLVSVALLSTVLATVLVGFRVRRMQTRDRA